MLYGIEPPLFERIIYILTSGPLTIFSNVRDHSMDFFLKTGLKNANILFRTSNGFEFRDISYFVVLNMKRHGFAVEKIISALELSKIKLMRINIQKIYFDQNYE